MARSPPAYTYLQVHCDPPPDTGECSGLPASETIRERLAAARRPTTIVRLVERCRWPGPDFPRLLRRAEALLHRPGRSVLGIAGAPASGKSTLAEVVYGELDHRYPGAVALVGMDAFHLAHEVLIERGTVDVKGAPETFDAAGYVALLKRLRESVDTVYAPEFRREIENSISAAVEIGPDVRLVITEGNYLLLPQPPWDAVRPLLDDAWFVRLDDELRRERMVARHERYGHDRASALAKTSGSDEANAILVDQAQLDPDVWVEHVSA
jgi:pantothenate kinase